MKYPQGIIYCLTFLCVLSCIAEAGGNFTAKHYFWPLDSKIYGLDLQLGKFHFECISFIEECTHGFTMSFWLNLCEGNSQNPLFTAGGQSEYTSGIYIVQTSAEAIETVVTKEARKWNTTVHLLQDGWSHVFINWDNSNGLVIYVDGFLAGKDGKGSRREFISSQYAVNSGVFIYPCPKSKSAMFKLSHWDEIKSVDSVLREQEFIDLHDEIYYRGCMDDNQVSDLLAGSAGNQDYPLSINATIYCRIACQQRSLKYGMIIGSTQCACLKEFSPSLLSKTPSDLNCPVNCQPTSRNCKGLRSWSAFLTSHSKGYSSTPPVLNFTFKIDNFDMGIVVNETIKLHLKCDKCGENAVFNIDFGNKVKIKSYKRLIIHSWTHSGSYTLDIVGQDGQATGKLSLPVKVQPPIIKAVLELNHRHIAQSKVQFEIMILGIFKSCKLDFGDGRMVSNLQSKQAQTETNVDHAYKVDGEFLSKLICTDTAGVPTSKEEMVIIRKPGTMDLEYMAKRMGDIIELDVVRTLPPPVIMYPDKAMILVHDYKPDYYQTKEFNCSGIHGLTIESDFEFRNRWSVDVYDQVKIGTFETRPANLTVNETASLLIELEEGFDADVHISFGDNETMDFIITSESPALNVTHIYTKAAMYKIVVNISNEVSISVRVLDVWVAEDYELVLGLILKASEMLEDLEGSDDKDGRMELRSQIVGMIAGISSKIGSVDSMKFTSSCLNKVTSATDELSPQSQETASNAVGSMAGKLGDFNTTQTVVVDVATDLTSCLGNAMISALETLPGYKKNSSEPQPSEPEEVDEALLLSKRSILMASIGSTDSVTNAVLLKEEVGGPGQTIETGQLLMKVQKDKADSIGKEPINATAGSIKVPMGTIGPDAGGEFVSTKFVEMKSNPFAWDKTANTIKSPVLSLSFQSDKGSEISVTDTEEPIEIFLNTDNTYVPENRAFLLNRTYGEQGMNYHKIIVNNPNSSIHITLTPTWPDNQTYIVYIRLEEYPTPEEFDYYSLIPIPDFNVSAYEDGDVLKNTFFITNKNTSTGGYYIGVSALIDPNELPSNDSTSSEYLLQVFTSGCKYWNTSSESWESDGCEVGPLTTIQKTQCFCTHLTAFGADFVVPPNSIDFSTVFQKFANLSDNAAVFSFVFTLLGLYMIGIIWARREDKKDLALWGATPILDNLQTDKYFYRMTVFTGMGKTSATTSKVSFVLSGEKGDTGVRGLNDGKRTCFTPGSVCNYVLGTSNSLGQLTYLRIWHDNSGKGKNASWFLSHVLIQDIQSDEKFLFICNEWLAVEEGDGRIDRILPSANIDDNTNRGYLFTTSVRKELFDGHLWFSVFARPTRSRFTRVQRISCCVSLLFCTMIANAMWFKTEETVERVSVMRLGPFVFSLHQVFISFMSTMVVLPVNMLQVQLFRKSRAKPTQVQSYNVHKKSHKYKWKKISPDSNILNKINKQSKMSAFLENVVKSSSNICPEKLDEEYLERKAKKQKLLPHWCVYIAWCSVFLSITTSGFFTILYSMEWGREKSNEWLTTMLLSFFQSVLLVQPVKVLALALVLSYILKKPGDQAEEDEEEEIDSYYVDTPIGEDMRKLRASAKHHMEDNQLQPMEEDDLLKAREQRLNELKMEAIIREIISYVMYVLVLLFICHHNRDHNSFQMTKSTKQLFLGDNIEIPMLQKVTITQDIYTWLNMTFIPAMYANSWYNGEEVSAEDKFLVGNMASIRVGPARLRQVRFRRDSCLVNELLANSQGCLGKTDKYSYTPGWNSRVEKKKASPKSIWTYQSALKLKNAPFVGKLGSYLGGGYVASLGPTQTTARNMLEDLFRLHWLDTKTHVLFIEFTIFSANVNLFSSVTIAAEVSETGNVFPMESMFVFRLHSYVGGFAIFLLICELAYILFLIMFIVQAVKKMVLERTDYFRNFWNVADLVIIILSIVSIAMYIMKKIFAELAIDTLKEHSHGEFVNFHSIALWDSMFGIILSTLAFISTVKSIRLLRFNKRMSLLGSTMQVIGNQIHSFILVFIIIFIAFAHMGYLLFSSTLNNYHNFIATAESLFSLMLGNFDYYDFENANRILGPLFLFTFTWIIVFGILGIFLSMVYEAFYIVRRDASLQSNEHEIVDFIWKRFKTLAGFT